MGGEVGGIVFHSPPANSFSRPQGCPIKWCSKMFRVCSGSILLISLPYRLGHRGQLLPRGIPSPPKLSLKGARG